MIGSKALRFIGSGLCCGLLFAVSPVTKTADADVMFSLDTGITNGTPGGTSPYLTVTVSDVGLNMVQFLFSTTLGSGNFLSDIYMNFNTGTLADSGFSESHVSGATASSVDFDADAFNLGGSHSNFDILFSFPTANNGRLGTDPGDPHTWYTTSTYTVSYTPVGSEVMNENSFSFLSTPDQNKTNAYFLAAHVQGLAGNPDSTKWGQILPPSENVTLAPVPGSIALLASGLVPFITFIGLRSRKKAA